MALIECKIRRKNGTTVPMGDQIYKFAPGKDGAHVCEVDDANHIDLFLKVTEAYKRHGAKDVIAPKAQPVKKNADGADDDTSEFEFDSLDRWTNRKLNAFAESLGMNPKSKESICDIAVEQFDVKLSKRKQPPAMIREFAEILRDGLGDNNNNDE